MRGAFIKTLADVAAEDRRIVLLTGDLGYMAIEPFADRFPDRFINVGVAEQNMVGVATGLAEGGYIPFVYSIVTFATLRPYEFVRNGPIMHRLPVRIVGVGGGFEYGTNGLTHYGLEDVGVFRVQPGIAIVAPADHAQAAAALRATWDLPGPIYYRLGKDDRTTVPGLEGKFALGRAQVIGEGDDVVLVSMGSVTADVLRAADLLRSAGVSCRVAIVASLSPAPVDDLVALLRNARLAVTVEAHYLVGGVGSLICEVVAEARLGCRVLRCGIERTPDGHSGSQCYLHQLFGISPEAVARRTLATLEVGCA